MPALSSGPVSPNKSQKIVRKKGDVAADRLYMDAEARRAREQRYRKDNKNVYQPFNYDTALRAPKQTQSDRSRATQDRLKKSSRLALNTEQASGRAAIQAGADSHKPSIQSHAAASKQSLPTKEHKVDSYAPSSSKNSQGLVPPSHCSILDAPPRLSVGQLTYQQQQEQNDRVLAYLDKTLKKQESILKLQESLSHSNAEH